MNVEPEAASRARERELFLGALDQPRPERSVFLAAVCGRDPGLRRRVEGLLREAEEMGEFLETPAAEISSARRPNNSEEGDTATVETVAEHEGDLIGRYKLSRKIGEGGCGIVYLAEQQEPVRRQVALKIIKSGMDTRSVIARFEAERQALALMDHPNIAKVLDAGATEAGRPYFVMELVPGVRITEFCDQRSLPPEDRLRLFVTVCHAIQHAHQKGIIHRDIKPSNILVTTQDGAAVPKVIDFGVAKATEQRLTENTVFTAFTAFIGTPAYMSPEQAAMSGLDIDTRSDIYSLGVLLYELLVGKTPFDAQTLLKSGLDACRRTILDTEPARPSARLTAMPSGDVTALAHRRGLEPSKLVHAVRGDLDWIVMKALEKDRSRRYATAGDLSADIMRYLENEPVVARPPSNLYRVRKMLRRNRGAFAAATVIATTLIAGAGVSVWQAVRATTAEQVAEAEQRREAQLRRRAEREKASARLNEYVADINLAQVSMAEGNYGRAVQLINKRRSRLEETDLRGFEWRYLWKLSQGSEHVSFPAQPGNVLAIALSPDSRLLAAGLGDRLLIWDVAARSLVTNLAAGASTICFSKDGRQLWAAGRDSVHIWNTNDWSGQGAIPSLGGAISLSPDGLWLATESREGVRLLETRTRSLGRLFAENFGPMAFSPDGDTLAVCSRSGIVLRSLTDQQAPVELENSAEVVAEPPFRRFHRVIFSPDGKYVLAPRNRPSAKGVFVLGVWDARTGKEMAALPDDPQRVEHTGAITSVAFSSDGHTLATSSWDHSIRLWDFATRRRVATLHGHLNEVWSIAFSADGKSIVSGAKDGGLNLWPIRAEASDELIPGDWRPLAFSADSKSLAAVDDREAAVAILNVANGQIEARFDIERSSFWFPTVALSGDLKVMAVGLRNGGVKLWKAGGGEPATIKVSGGNVSFVALTPDGRSLISGGRDSNLIWQDLDGARAPLTIEAEQAHFSGDGKTMVTWSRRRGPVRLWDVANRSLRSTLRIDPPNSVAAISFDGRVLATTGGPEETDDAIRLWDAATGRLTGVCLGHKQPPSSVAFSPDGRTLATTAADSTLKLWNVATQQELLTDRRVGGGLNSALFSDDGQMLVTSSSFPTAGIRFYRAPKLEDVDRLAQAK